MGGKSNIQQIYRSIVFPEWIVANKSSVNRFAGGQSTDSHNSVAIDFVQSVLNV